MANPKMLIVEKRIKQIAFISDIHGNLEALLAVLREIKNKGIEKIICVGDVVGYGADPGACIEIIRENEIPSVQGNHDFYVCSDRGIRSINRAAYVSILWTKENVSPEQKEWLSQLPLVFEFESISVVHSSLKDPDAWDYVLDKEQAEKCFSVQNTAITIIGHSHRPYIFCKSDNTITGDVLHTEIYNKLNKYIVNTGSVGQPRDNQSTASYLIYDAMRCMFSIERVEYDVETAKRKIIKRGLPWHNAVRLTPSV
jgi:predicted phosphodiesterase